MLHLLFRELFSYFFKRSLPYLAKYSCVSYQMEVQLHGKISGTSVFGYFTSMVYLRKLYAEVGRMYRKKGCSTSEELKYTK